jgi:signal transduction histidine kinase/ligand-binding sensor domain-containing protein
MSTRMAVSAQVAVTWLVLVFSVTTALSQVSAERVGIYLHDVWGTESGLPQSSITAIAQTRDGYLWLGTFGGLARFDGVKFTVFEKANSPGLQSNRVTALYEDRAGNLWVGLEHGGVARYTQGKFTSFGFASGMPDLAVIAVKEDQQGNIWLNTHAGLTYLSKEGITTQASYFGLPRDLLSFALAGRDGSVWLRTPQGLARFHAGITTRFSFRAPFICETEDGSVWVHNFEQGLLRFHQGKWTEFPINDELPSRTGPEAHFRMPYAFTGRANTICILTSAGLSRFKEGKQVYYQLINDLPYAEVVFEDREGNLWIGSNITGIHRYKEAPIEAFTAKEGLSDDGFLPITEDGAGGLWLGGDKLYHFQAGKFAAHPFGLKAWALQYTRDGALWGGFYGGLLSLKGDAITRYPTLDKLQVVAIFEDQEGTMWAGTNEGLYRYQDGSFTVYRTGEGLIHNNVRHITQDRQGTLWIGTLGGLSRLQNGKFTNYTTAQGLSDNHVRDIYEDADGTLWFGTYGGGLNRYKDGRFTPIMAKDGLFDNVVSRILEDERGNFWMSCNRGIYRASRRELNDFTDGRTASINCIAYGVADGMKSSECNGNGQPAGWKDRTGKLWFPTIQGVVMIDPQKINELPPPVAIEQVTIDHQPMDLWQWAVAPPGKGDLEIHYTGLSLVAPEKMRFKYKLEGYDEDWVNAGARRVAYYTNLAPGGYTFKVIASNNDGVWNQAGAQFTFSLRPHFYQTKWFYALSVAGLIGLVVFGYRRRVAHLRQRHAEQRAFSRQLIESQENERKRIAAELHDSLGQSLIIIRNRALLSLNKPDDHERALAQMEEISTAAAQAISEVKEIAYNLRPYQLDRLGLTKALEGMIAGLSETCGVKFKVELDNLDGLLPPDDEISLYRVVQESVSNIVKHSGATEATVAVKHNSHNLHVYIQDNGKGFNPDTTDGTGARQRGFGLIGIAERAHMLGAKHQIRTAPGKGVTVEIKIELNGRRDAH